jgi:4-hydroxythreonine-4-phosphate dehydrogenase
VTSRGPVVISMGEPSGIGPEVAVKAWAALEGKIADRAIRLVGSPAVFRAAAAQCSLDAQSIENDIIDVGGDIVATPGMPSSENASAVTSAISECVRFLKAGDAAALVTAPINKAVLTAAGFGFPGHTEFLAALTGRERGVMMLSAETLSPPLRVVPLTVHESLKTALEQISSEAICTSAEILIAALKKDFAIDAPRIAIAGVNPHAGESGTMGAEDEEILAPAVSALRAHGHAVSGPFPADTLFHEEARKEYDAALCMYHDQALIPIKTLAFWTSVNVTLGLPIVRTSPDHGTALDIAGRGIADEKSMIAAIRLAAEIADRRGL